MLECRVLSESVLLRQALMTQCCWEQLEQVHPHWADHLHIDSWFTRHEQEHAESTDSRPYTQFFPYKARKRLVHDFYVFRWHKRFSRGCAIELSAGIRQLSGGKIVSHTRKFASTVNIVYCTMGTNFRDKNNRVHTIKFELVGCLHW